MESKIAVTIIVMAGAAVVLNYLTIDMNIGFHLLFLVGLLWLLYRIKLDDAIFDGVAASVIYIFLQTGVIYLIEVIDPNVIANDYCLTFVIAIMGGVIFILKKKCQQILIIQEKYRDWQYEIRWILADLMLIGWLLLFFWNRTAALEDATGKWIVLAFTIIMLIFNGVLLKHMLENRYQRELLEKQLQMDKIKEEYMDCLAEEQHEFRKHIQTISGLTQMEDTKAVMKYIETLTGGKCNGDRTVFAGDSAISAYLYSKKKEAKEKGVQFQYRPCKPFPDFLCSKNELIEIIGNLVDNAFDAVLNLDESKRTVLLNIGENEKGKYIETVNNMMEGQSLDLSRIVEKRFTTKSGTLRGYGLFNVQNIVKKYDGQLKIVQQGNQILIQVLFE